MQYIFVSRPRCRFLSEHCHDQVADAVAELGPIAMRFQRFLGEYLFQNVRGVFTEEWLFQREKLVEECPQREDIARSRWLSVLHSFRSHVVEGAEDLRPL